jgi:hypothetical protein
MRGPVFQSQASQWTERRALLPAGLSYLFSLDAALASEAGNAVTLRTFSRRRESDPKGRGSRSISIGRLENLFGSSSVNVAGTPRVPPVGNVVSGMCTFDPGQSADEMSLEGDFTVELDGSQEPLRVTCTGVLSSTRPLSARNGTLPQPNQLLEGRLFVVSVQECATPDLRWLIRTQLFGVGRLSSTLDKERLKVSHRFGYDFYVDQRPPYIQGRREVNGRYP